VFFYSIIVAGIWMLLLLEFLDAGVAGFFSSNYAGCL
jgi:hypothetical protein